MVGIEVVRSKKVAHLVIQALPKEMELSNESLTAYRDAVELLRLLPVYEAYVFIQEQQGLPSESKQIFSELAQYLLGPLATEHAINDLTNGLLDKLRRKVADIDKFSDAILDFKTNFLATLINAKDLIPVHAGAVSITAPFKSVSAKLRNDSSLTRER
ncbi:MAG: hypothetical protein Q7V63_09995 [Gammaproteobacteria bacterium]|nr:hypothetical protein [Gammaproteobacteria bacterium]